MSAPFVREEIMKYLVQEFPTEKVLDISGEAHRLEDFLAKNGVSKNDKWVAVYFTGDDEEVASIATTNGKGCWVEWGSIHVECLGPTGQLGGVNSLVARAHAFKKKLRSKRIGSLTIESVTPPNTELGSGFTFDSGYSCASISAYYRYEDNE